MARATVGTATTTTDTAATRRQTIERLRKQAGQDLHLGALSSAQAQCTN